MIPSQYSRFKYIKGVKKVHSAIKLCFYYFSYNVCNDINVTETHLTHLIKNKRRDDKSKILSRNKLSSKYSITRKFWAQGAKWGYDKKPLTCNCQSDKSNYKSVKNP